MEYGKRLQKSKEGLCRALAEVCRSSVCLENKDKVVSRTCKKSACKKSETENEHERRGMMRPWGRATRDALCHTVCSVLRITPQA